MNIDNNFFDGMVNHIYPSELQLNKANVSDTEASIWIYIDLYRMVFHKRDYLDFDIVNFPFLDGDVTRLTSYVVYIFQFNHFAEVSSHVDDFKTRNKTF